MSIEMDVTPSAAQLSRAPKFHEMLDSQPSDSGYATQSTSPDTKSTDSSLQKSTTVESKARAALLSLPPMTDLAEYDKPVDDKTLARFRHVHIQIEKPLLDYIRRKLPRSKYRPIALRLMILGRNEDDAKPCIAALCPEEQCKKVRNFFDKSSVRLLCQPKDDTMPSFDVFVLGGSLEAKHADKDFDIFIPIVGDRQGYTDETYCGAPIVIRNPLALDRKCTFGGIIKAVPWNGDTKLYGLTVGHVLLDDLDDDLTTGTTGNESESLRKCELEISDSESEDESDEMTEQEPEETASLPALDNPQLDPGANNDTFVSWASTELGKIGRISEDTIKTMGDGAGRYYDWALIEMEQHKPNRIRSRKLSDGEIQGKNISSGDLLTPVKPPCSSGKRQPITLLSGSEGLKRGYLSPLPSRLLLGPGNTFVDIFILILDDNQQIQDGDSGSWVVNEATLEVYGYVVAADSFGGGYVIPLLDAFQSIAASLGLCSVGLATTVDMAVAKLGGDRSTVNESRSTSQPTEQRWYDMLETVPDTLDPYHLGNDPMLNFLFGDEFMAEHQFDDSTVMAENSTDSPAMAGPHPNSLFMSDCFLDSAYGSCEHSFPEYTEE